MGSLRRAFGELGATLRVAMSLSRLRGNPEFDLSLLPTPLDPSLEMCPWSTQQEAPG